VSNVASGRGNEEEEQTYGYGSLQISSQEGIRWIAVEDQPALIKGFLGARPGQFRGHVNVQKGEYLDLYVPSQHAWLPGVVEEIATSTRVGYGVEIGSVNICTRCGFEWVSPASFAERTSQRTLTGLKRNDKVCVYDDKFVEWLTGIVAEVLEASAGVTEMSLPPVGYVVMYKSPQGRGLKKTVTREQCTSSFIRRADPTLGVGAQVSVLSHTEKNWYVTKINEISSKDLIVDGDKVYAGSFRVGGRKKTDKHRWIQPFEFDGSLEHGSHIANIAWFGAGDCVWICHHDDDKWVSGFVTGVLIRSEGGIPAGSVKVSWAVTLKGGKAGQEEYREQWILPKDVKAKLKLGQKKFEVGDKVEVNKSDTKAWVQGVVEELFDSTEGEGALYGFSHSVKVSTDNFSIWIAPENLTSSLRHLIAVYKPGSLVWVLPVGARKPQQAKVEDYCERDQDVNGVGNMRHGSAKLLFSESGESTWIDQKDLEDLVKGPHRDLVPNERIHVFDRRIQAWRSGFVDDVFEDQFEDDDFTYPQNSALISTEIGTQLLYPEDVPMMTREPGEHQATDDLVDVFSSKHGEWKPARILQVVETSHAFDKDKRIPKGSIHVKLEDGGTRWIMHVDRKQQVRKRNRVYLPKERIQIFGRSGTWLDGVILDTKEGGTASICHFFGRPSSEDVQISAAQMTARVRDWRPKFSKGQAVAFWNGSRWLAGVIEKVNLVAGAVADPEASKDGGSNDVARVAYSAVGAEQKRRWISWDDLQKNLVRDYMEVFLVDELVKAPPRKDEKGNAPWQRQRQSIKSDPDQAIVTRGTEYVPSMALSEHPHVEVVAESAFTRTRIEVNDTRERRSLNAIEILGKKLLKVEFGEGDEVDVSMRHIKMGTMHVGHDDQFDEDEWEPRKVEAVARAYFRSDTQSVPAGSVKVSGISAWILPTDRGVCLRAAPLRELSHAPGGARKSRGSALVIKKAKSDVPLHRRTILAEDLGGLKDDIRRPANQASIAKKR
jgi:hypothetical protein